MAQVREVTRERTNVAVSSSEEEKEVTILTINRIIYYIGGILETFLFFRFILKLLGANPFSPFVAFIYSLSGIFEAPFRGIFPSAVSQGLGSASVLEPSTIFAILVYLVLIFGIVEFIKVLSGGTRT